MASSPNPEIEVEIKPEKLRSIFPDKCFEIVTEDLEREWEQRIAWNDEFSSTDDETSFDEEEEQEQQESLVVNAQCEPDKAKSNASTDETPQECRLNILKKDEHLLDSVEQGIAQIQMKTTEKVTEHEEASRPVEKAILDEKQESQLLPAEDSDEALQTETPPSEETGGYCGRQESRKQYEAKNHKKKERVRRKHEREDPIRNPKLLMEQCEYDSDDDNKDFYMSRRQSQSDRNVSRFRGAMKAVWPSLATSEITSESQDKIRHNAEVLKPLRHKWFQLKIQLVGIRFDIWRRVIVPASISLASLQDRVICPAFGWPRDAHMYMFRLPSAAYPNKKKPLMPFLDMSFGPTNAKYDESHIMRFRGSTEMIDDSKVALLDVVHKTGDKLKYIHNLKDKWRFAIELEAVESDLPNKTVQLVDGQGAGPPVVMHYYSFTIDEFETEFVGPHAYCITLDILFNPDKYHSSFQKLAREKMETYEERRRQSEDGYPEDTELNSPFDPAKFDIEATRKRIRNCVRGNAIQKGNLSPMSLAPALMMGDLKLYMNMIKNSRRHCSFCKLTEGQLKKTFKCCSRCRGVYYCGEECQKKDWKNDHKRLCVRLR